MGFLKVLGRPLDWEESKIYFDQIRTNAVETVIDWIKGTNQTDCQPLFGYESEFHKIYVDELNKRILLDLSGENTVTTFIEEEEEKHKQSNFIFQLEYGKWMIECKILKILIGVPSKPLSFGEIYQVENSIFEMYEFAKNNIGKNRFLSMAAYPMLGIDSNYKFDSRNSDELEDIFSNIYKNNNSISHSIYVDDIIIGSHPRFAKLTENIRKRRGKKVEIKIPIYLDIHTQTESTLEEPYPGYIYMDAMAFGMGNCSFQITLGASSLNSACFIHDQLLPWTPIFLAISSSGPIFKGKLSGYDNRFDIIAQSVDDRTEEEKNILSSKYISKSRYSPSYSYISENVYVQEYLNDYPRFPINNDYLKKLKENGIPRRLSEHFCNLITRDPLVIFDKKIEINDLKDRTHFENFNSTNWNSLRFKLPKIEDNDSCFKIEFRPCDLQLTSTENTAIVTFVVLLYQSLLKYDVNFVIPISMVDENFNRAYKMNSVTLQKFYWRINGIDENLKDNSSQLKERHFLKPNDTLNPITSLKDDISNIKELTIKEILYGSEEYQYPGVISLCSNLIDSTYTDYNTRLFLHKYLEFISQRASGELWTDAKYIRNFVEHHPLYKQDSVVTEVNLLIKSFICRK